MDKNKFRFIQVKETKNYLYSKIRETNLLKDFLKRFFKSKINIFFTIIFFTIILLLIFGRFFSPYSATEAINKNDTNFYIGNLPPSYISHRTTIISNEALLIELQKYNTTNPAINLQFKTLLGDQKEVIFNYAELLKTFNNQNFITPILGTNYIGLDIWNETLISGFNSLILGLVIAFLEMVIGSILGSYLGYFAEKKWAIFLSKIIDMINAVPTLIWFTVLVIILPNNFIFLYLSFLLVGWAAPAYWSRFYILKIKEDSFIQASISLGTPIWRIILLEAMPNYIGKIISLFARRVTYIIFFAASISFLGFESSNSFPTIGKTFINGMKGYRSNFWQLFFPGIIMALLTFSIQFIAFGIEKSLDPKR